MSSRIAISPGISSEMSDLDLLTKVTDVKIRTLVSRQYIWNYGSWDCEISYRPMAINPRITLETGDLDLLFEVTTVDIRPFI